VTTVIQIMTLLMGSFFCLEVEPLLWTPLTPDRPVTTLDGYYSCE
jgi:hypothetical protein